MDIDEFRATSAPLDDEIWAATQQLTEVPDGASRNDYVMYDGCYVLYKYDGKWWPHAWWYPPVPRDSLAEAEEILYEWRKEWL